MPGQVQMAERRAETEKTPEAAELVKKMQGRAQPDLELDIYRRRSELQPTNLSLKYELGVRLKRAGKYQEAIQNAADRPGPTASARPRSIWNWANAFRR